MKVLLSEWAFEVGLGYISGDYVNEVLLINCERETTVFTRVKGRQRRHPYSFLLL